MAPPTWSGSFRAHVVEQDAQRASLFCAVQIRRNDRERYIKSRGVNRCQEAAVAAPASITSAFFTSPRDP